MRLWVGVLVAPSVVCLMPLPARAEVRVPAVIGDHMVIQRHMKVPIWGAAEPRESIQVRFARARFETTADADGRWKIPIGPFEAGGPYTMIIKGARSRVVLADVLVGEVWLASGQSNMQLPLRAASNAQQEIAEANYPSIRLFSAPMLASWEPVADVAGSWTPCTPETVPGFSAVAYFFGRELHKKLGVPIGLIHSAWGSTVDTWIPRETLEADPTLEPLVEAAEKAIADYPAALAKWETDHEAWVKASEEARAEGKEPPKEPVEPGDPKVAWSTPSVFFNGMIQPLLPFGIRGVIWYQGESDTWRPRQYRTLFPLVIRDWRARWGEGDFPFIFAQLPNFRERKAGPSDSDWAELREAQATALSLPNTGMAVTIDIGDGKDIHPKNKQDVGKRLAAWALGATYGQKGAISGPLYESMVVEGRTIRLRFAHTDGGLVAGDGGKLTGFALAGDDKSFVWAEAEVEGDTVVVSSPRVPAPVAVRYAWADNPECNLCNGAGLPASPFRTDDWPGGTR